MPHKKRLYAKQKLHLYFDENFPQAIVSRFRESKYFKKKFKVFSAYDFNNEGKDDNFHYSFCKRNKFVLITLDHHFMDDGRFPIKKISGIIFIPSAKNNIRKISTSLRVITSFLSDFPYPRIFMGDSKFQVNPKNCIMRGRSRTGVIKTVTIGSKGANTVWEVASQFGYFD